MKLHTSRPAHKQEHEVFLDHIYFYYFFKKDYLFLLLSIFTSRKNSARIIYIYIGHLKTTVSQDVTTKRAVV